MSFTRAEKSANVVEAFPRILTVRNIANPQHLIRIKSVRVARGACGGGACGGEGGNLTKSSDRVERATYCRSSRLHDRTPGPHLRVSRASPRKASPVCVGRKLPILCRILDGST